MIQSMTGYGKATVHFGNKTITIEIRSLNSKTFDLSCRIAPAYKEHEMEIRGRLAKTLLRGKADFSISVEKNVDTASMVINPVVIENYYNQIKGISDKTSIPLPNDWYPTLLRLPDVLERVDIENVTKEEWESVGKGIDEAIDNFIAFRRQEGEALAVKFKENVDTIQLLLSKIELYESERVEKIRSRIVDALKEIPEASYDANRLEQELIYYIEKLDISEEKQRLSNHLKYFNQTMEEESGQGKKLGFIAQEMGREINTTGSKSNHAQMQNIVVEMKDALEQIKEQVLNVL